MEQPPNLFPRPVSPIGIAGRFQSLALCSKHSLTNRFQILFQSFQERVLVSLPIYFCASYFPFASFAVWTIPRKISRLATDGGRSILEPISLSSCSFCLAILLTRIVSCIVVPISGESRLSETPQLISFNCFI